MRSLGAWKIFCGVIFFAAPAWAMGTAKPASPAVPPQWGHGGRAQALKVLTLNFNSENVPNDSTGEIRDLRFTAMVDWVKTRDVDVIFLQEAWNYGKDASVAKTLAQALDYDVSYVLTMGLPGFMYDSNAVLAKKSFHMDQRASFTLAHSWPRVGDGQNWVIAFGGVSMAVGARLTLENGEPLYAYSTHLIGASDGQKDDQIADLEQNLREQVEKTGGDYASTKVIIGGDMNSLAESPAMMRLKNSGYEDTWAQAHPNDPGITLAANPKLPGFNPIVIGAGLFPDQSNEKNNERIDHIYVKGMYQKTLASTLSLVEPYDGVWMSDHYGVLSTIGMNGEMPSGVANPVDDATRALPEATVLEVGDAFFLTEDPSQIIEVRGPRGLAVVNYVRTGIHVGIETGGRLVYTNPNSDLGYDGAAAFVFTVEGDYRTSFRTTWGQEVVRTVRYRAE